MLAKMIFNLQVQQIIDQELIRWHWFNSLKQVFLQKISKFKPKKNLKKVNYLFKNNILKMMYYKTKNNIHF